MHLVPQRPIDDALVLAGIGDTPVNGLFGSSLFISVAVLVVIRSTASNYARLTEFIIPYNKILSMPGVPASWSLDSAAGLLSLSNEIQRQAAMIGYVNAFYLTAFTAVAAIPLAGLMRRVAR